MPKITDAEPAVERRPSAPSAPPHAPHLSQQPPSGSSTGTGGKRPTPVKRACDQCHFRRVKCDGQLPCNNCPRLSVQCTYEKPRLRGTSGKRINALRADQSQQQPGQPHQVPHQQGPQHPSQQQQRSPVDLRYNGTPASRLESSLSQQAGYPAPLVSSSQLSPSQQTWAMQRLPAPDYPLLPGALSSPSTLASASVSLQTHDSSFASFLESSFSSLPPEVSASYRLPNVDTFIPDTFFESKPDLSGAGQLDATGGSGVGAGHGFFGGFGGLGFLHPSPPSWGGSEGSPQNLMMHPPPGSTPARAGPSPSSLPLAPSQAHSHSRPQPPPPASPLSESILIPHIALFFERLHPIMPIFTRAWLFARLDRSEHQQDPQFAALLLAMSALALTQPVQASEQAAVPEQQARARQLLEEACRMRASALFGQHATIDAVLTSFYIFACLFGMKEDNAAWFRLTEAVTLGQLLKLHLPGSYEGLEKGERERRLRTYWILCITERAYALQRGHPITFRGRPSQTMDAVSGGLQIGELDDFPVRHLKLFDSVDEDFIDCWNGRCAGRACRTLDAARALALHKQLSEPLEGAHTPSQESFEVFSSLTSTWKRGEIQSADVLITQQWLLNRLWRLAMSHGLIDPAASEPALRVDAPVTLAHAALAICNRLSMPSIEAHGIGYLEKLYDIATTLAVLSQYAPEVVSQPTEDGLSVSQLLAEYVALFRRFRGGDHPFMGKLLDSVGHLLPP